MAIRAKFTVQSILKSLSGNQVTLTPVTGGSKENESFFKYTPYGEIKIGIVNDEVASQLIVGKSFYVDFTEAE